MPVYVKAEVGGIQNFIGSTGKLKEMIGGSEIICHICQKEFYESALAEIGCSAEMTGTELTHGHMLLQNNAGVFALLLPDETSAKGFLKRYSQKALEDFPGLPLFGALAPMEWSGAGLAQARREVDEKIMRQRMYVGAAFGVPMLPVLLASRLDGMPTVDIAREDGREDGEVENISLISQCKRDPKMVKQSQKRLRKLAQLEDGAAEWADDIEKMLGDSGSKVALIHMDGNDLGKLFGSRLKECANASLIAGIEAMKELSRAIQEINEGAFAHAAKHILQYEQNFAGKSSVVMPLRPLVMGGDDITLIARADIALLFIDLFTQRYQALANEKNVPLSLGIGMVIMDSSYPFAKSFALVESLLESAKHLTLNMQPRPSSLDYLLLTEDVENDAEALRERVYTAADGSRLTARPMILQKHTLANFLENGREILSTLPRSGLRPAFSACRAGRNAAHAFWLNARENLKRRLGGRKGAALMSPERFDSFFPDNYFQKNASGEYFTNLGDYLELAHILPAEGEARNTMLKIMLEGNRENV